MTTPQGSPDFPIPADIEGFWQWDKMHCPRPQTPLTEDFFLAAVAEGFTRGMDEFASPVGFHMRVINRYGYASIVPVELEGETIEERVGRYQQTLHEVLPRMGELWEQEWLPSILPGIERGRDTDYGALSDGELLARLSEMREEFIDRYVVHGKINFVTISASVFADFYNETFAPDDPTEPYQALQGFPTRSVDAGRGLWALGRKVKGSATLTKLFQELEPSELMTALEGSEEGREFLAPARAVDSIGHGSTRASASQRGKGLG